MTNSRFGETCLSFVFAENPRRVNFNSLAHRLSLNSQQPRKSHGFILSAPDSNTELQRGLIMDSILDLHKCVIGQHSSCHISSPKNLSINFATDHNFKDSSKYALRSTLLKICITQKLTFVSYSTSKRNM